MAQLNPSQLPGTHRERVFIGGAYQRTARSLLDDLAQSVKDVGFYPILADQFLLSSHDHDIHDVTLWLLHACRLAIFEVSAHSGALMEIERLRDYGIRKALLLYHDPSGKVWPKDEASWQTTQMLKSLVREQRGLLTVRSYVRPAGAVCEARDFLRAIKRSAYGKLHRV